MAAQHQLKILSGVIALIILAGAIVLMAYYWEKVLRPEKVAIQQVEAVKEGGDTVAPPPDPGLKSYNAAVEFIHAEDWNSAKAQLAYLMRYYPDSSKYPDAKRILGEINADLLLSNSPMPGKIEHTVHSGDYFSVLQKKYHTTIDFILRANSRTTHFVRIGEKLWVMPLYFAMEANLTDKTLTVYKIEEAPPQVADGADPASAEAEEEVFFKEYQIVDVNLPPTVSIPYNTKISSKPAWLGNKRATFEQPEYHLAQKWLQTSKVGVAVKAAPADIENASEDRKMGILMSESDMSELFTYVRVGAPLRLIN